MNSETLYRGYDRTALDTQYNARAAVPEHVQIVERWEHDGVQVCHEFGPHLDLAYGASAPERLDLFPVSTAESSPVQVFFHGGYWMGRDKSTFRFLARTFVPAGAVFITVNYGLIPTVDMDELVRQCRAAMMWVYKNVAKYGGDPGRIFVSGHSAGGHIVAMLMATDWSAFAGLPGDLIKAGCSVSGLFELEPMRLCYLHDTLNLDADQVARNSPIRLAPFSREPLIIAVGGAESDEFRRQSVELGATWNQRGASCQVMERPGLNHYTIVEEFADRARPLGQAVMSQMGMV
ncbi:MAG: alpha/beta hydrolase [Acidiferrobacterales bacterium]